MDPSVTIHKVLDERGKVIDLVNVRTCCAILNLWRRLSSKASLSCDCSPEIEHSRGSIKEEQSGRTWLKTL